jgi:hypothetical protein
LLANYLAIEINLIKNKEIEMEVKNWADIEKVRKYTVAPVQEIAWLYGITPKLTSEETTSLKTLKTAIEENNNYLIWKILEDTSSEYIKLICFEAIKKWCEKTIKIAIERKDGASVWDVFNSTDSKDIRLKCLEAILDIAIKNKDVDSMKRVKSRSLSKEIWIKSLKAIVAEI